MNFRKMNLTELKSLKESFDAMSSREQFKWLINTPLKDEFIVNLHNDTTDILFIADENADYVMYLKEKLGYRGGIVTLLESMGLNVEIV